MQISNEVLAEFSAATISADGRRLILTRQVDRRLYVAINKVIEALGGKWSRPTNAHVFGDDARDRLEAALVSGEVTTDAELGFFQTPIELARRLVALAGPRWGIDLCLEPSAGMGRIVAALVEVGAGVTAIERHPYRRAQLAQRFASWEPVTVLQPATPDGMDDFMEFTSDEPFDRVVMNPPFLRCGLGDHLDHVRHAYAMLAPDGVLVTVLPGGVRFREDRRHREFRAWLEARGTIEDLPADAFKESGTRVRTCVARLVGGVA